MKKGIIVLAVGTAVLMGSGTIIKTSLAKADGEPLESSEIELSSESSSESTIDIKSQINSYAEKIKSEYDDKLKNTSIMGMSLGALIGVAVNVLAISVKGKKENETIAKIKDKVVEFKAKADEYEATIKTLTNASVETAKEYLRQLEGYKELINGYEAQMKEAAEKLSDYAETNDKINAVIEMLKALASSTDNIKDGIADKVEETAKMVMSKYGKE